MLNLRKNWLKTVNNLFINKLTFTQFKHFKFIFFSFLDLSQTYTKILNKENHSFLDQINSFKYSLLNIIHNPYKNKLLLINKEIK